MLTALSVPQLARRLPSGEKRTCQTSSGCLDVSAPGLDNSTTTSDGNRLLSQKWSVYSEGGSSLV